MMMPENDGGGGEQDGEKASFWLPKDYPGAESFKPGDTITLSFIGRDEDGDLEVKPGAGAGEEETKEKEDPWEGLDEHMGGAPQTT